MKADLRISIKDYRRNKSLKIQLRAVPFAAARQFGVRMNGRRSADCPNPQRVARQTRLEKSHVVRSGAVLRVGTTRAPLKNSLSAAMPLRYQAALFFPPAK